MPGAREHVRATCPRDCYDACGIIAIKRGVKSDMGESTCVHGVEVTVTRA